MIRRATLGLALGLGLGCAGPVEPEEPPALLGVGDRRTVRLVRPDEAPGPRRFALGQIRRLPPDRLAQLWVGDLPVLDRAERPGLLSALLTAAPPEDPSEGRALGQAWAGLSLADVDWASTTVMGPLVRAGQALGFDGVGLLAQVLDQGLEAPLWAPEHLARALAEGLIASHPQAWRRPGDAAPQRPIEPGSVPLSLADLLVGEGAALAARWGPSHIPGAYHPGVVSAARLAPAPDDLLVTVQLAQRPTLHAALDLEQAAATRVPGQDAAVGLINPNDPDWLQLEGALSEQPTVAALALTLPLDPRPLDTRTWTAGPQPTPSGQAGGWTTAPWTLDALSLNAAWHAWQAAEPRQVGWPAGAPTVGLELRAGWLSLSGPELPTGAYVWEAVAEGARRLADGAEPVTLAGDELPLGLDGVAFHAQVVEALAAQPRAVGALVLALLAPASADSPDLYLDETDGGPWLVAVAPDGEVPGPRFFGDAALTQPLDDRGLAAGGRPRAAVRAGGTLYVVGDSGAVFRLEVERFEVDGPLIAVTRLR